MHASATVTMQGPPQSPTTSIIDLLILSMSFPILEGILCSSQPHNDKNGEGGQEDIVIGDGGESLQKHNDGKVKIGNPPELFKQVAW